MLLESFAFFSCFVLFCFVVKDFERDLLGGEVGRRVVSDAMTFAMPPSQLYSHIHSARVNQHPPVHHQGWMINGQKNNFLLDPSSLSTMVVSSVAFSYYNLQVGY